MSSPYYEGLKQLARDKREHFGLTTDTIGLKTIRDVFRREGIKVDGRRLSRRIRAVYMCDENDPSVMINESLPKEPRLFALVHELKHHFCDREILDSGQILCCDYIANRDIEIGAEVFAAEFIQPEAEFRQLALDLGLRSGQAKPEDIVRLKRSTKASVSYTFLRKRFEFVGLIPRGAFATVKFTRLEEQLYGVPIYKEPWFKNFRARRAANTRVS